MKRKKKEDKLKELIDQEAIEMLEASQDGKPFEADRRAAFTAVVKWYLIREKINEGDWGEGLTEPLMDEPEEVEPTQKESTHGLTANA